MSYKVVYNATFGGFGLSRAAVLRAREISNNPTWGGASIKGDVFDDGSVCGADYGSVSGIQRHDPVLVRVVEELGRCADGSFARLQITEVAGAYKIDEYDGMEEVVEPADVTWIDPSEGAGGGESPHPIS